LCITLARKTVSNLVFVTEGPYTHKHDDVHNWYLFSEWVCKFCSRVAVKESLTPHHGYLSLHFLKYFQIIMEVHVICKHYSPVRIFCSLLGVEPCWNSEKYWCLGGTAASLRGGDRGPFESISNFIIWT
jgi:hypothetical protein